MNPYAIPAEHREVIERLFKGGDQMILQITQADLSLLHAAIGIAGEAAELEKAVMALRTALGAQTLDVANILEKLGNHLFYEGALRIATGLQTLVLSNDTGDDPVAHVPTAWLERTGKSPLELMLRSIPRQLVLSHLVGIHTVIAGDILDVVKKHTVYRKELDLDNLRKLLLQDCWVMHQIALILNTSEVALRTGNITKLVTGPKARDKEGYSDEAAVLRIDKEEGE
jgi:hypothetical protein